MAAPAVSRPRDPCADPVIRAIGIAKGYAQGQRSIQALPTIDFSLNSAELVAVVGPSRCGKTTLVNLLAGWEVPDSGSITWGTSNSAPPWSTVGVVPQALVLLDELSVAENIGLPARFRGPAEFTDGDTSGKELAAALGLERLLGRSTAEISVGERQRVMVARALVGRPAIVLADEPTAHQDDRNAEAVLDLLRDTVVDGASCIVFSRDPSVARDATRVVDLSDLT